MSIERIDRRLTSQQRFAQGYDTARRNTNERIPTVLLLCARGGSTANLIAGIRRECQTVSRRNSTDAQAGGKQNKLIVSICSLARYASRRTAYFSNPFNCARFERQGSSERDPPSATCVVRLSCGRKSLERAARAGKTTVSSAIRHTSIIIVNSAFSWRIFT